MAITDKLEKLLERRRPEERLSSPSQNPDPDEEMDPEDEDSQYGVSEDDVESANSIIGGDPIEGAPPQQRVFNFTLPFSNPLAGRINFKTLTPAALQSLLPSPSRPTSLYEEIDSDDEHFAYSHPDLRVNPRTHALRSSLMPSLTSSSPLPRITGNVVIMGGYRGSVLRDTKTKRQIWVPLKVGLLMRKINLELGPTDQDEYDAANYIYPDGVLSHIGPVDVSRRLINQLRAMPECNLTEFGYDWRLSCDINSEKLTALLKQLKDQDPKHEGAIVIAHSMGGLIAHHALQKSVRNGEKLIRGIVYAGSPTECPPILGPLRVGDSVMLAKHILTPKVNFLMRSSFVFLPRNGRCFVDKNNLKKEYVLDFFDPQTWVKYNLSPCVAKDPIVRRMQNAGDPDGTLLDYDVALEYLTRTLKRTKKFLDDLERIPGAEYPPMAVIYGNTLPSARGAKVADEAGIATTNYSDLWYGAGDGVVYRRSLVPLALGFPEVEAIPSKNGHIGLLSDLDAVAKALEEVLGPQEAPDPSMVPQRSPSNGRLARTKQKLLSLAPLRSRSRSRSQNGRLTPLSPLSPTHSATSTLSGTLSPPNLSPSTSPRPLTAQGN